MKTLIITTLILLPCILLVNESETVIPNIIGLCYVCLLYLSSRTKFGKLFISKLEKEVDRINEKLN